MPAIFARLPTLVAITSLTCPTGTYQTFTDGTSITVTSDCTAHTIAVNTSTGATLIGTQTLTYKTITAAYNSVSIALTVLSNATIYTAADTYILLYYGSSTPEAWKNQTVTGAATISTPRVLTDSASVIVNAKQASETFAQLRSR